MENEELVELIRAGINVKANMSKLYEQNKPFMYQQVQKYKGMQEMDDIMQECYFILDKAVESYDARRGTFIGWLAKSIGYQMPRRLSQLSDVRVPQYMNDIVVLMTRFIKQYQNDHGRYPTDQEILDNIEITEKELHAVRRIGFMRLKESLNAPISGEITLEDAIIDEHDNYSIVEDNIDNAIFSIILYDSLDVLTKQQRDIMELYINGRSTIDICADLGINHRQQVHESMKQGIKKIRKKLQRNGKIRMLYEDAYKGSLSSFNQTFTSTPEKLAINHISAEIGIA